MKEIPILFKTGMVQAILAGKKTQTRRIIKRFGSPLKNVSIGDVLWVKETYSDKDALLYRADVPVMAEKVGWKPSVFMKKEYCRIFLNVTAISFQKINDISEEEAIKEGFENRDFFMKYFFCINKIKITENPSVMVISFEKVRK